MVCSSDGAVLAEDYALDGGMVVCDIDVDAASA